MKDESSGPGTLVTRVILTNYKSIESADVRLGPFNVLVGPNGAGKSNFLDALRLVSDALRSTLENALRERGGITEVRRRSRGHPTHFEIQLELDLGRTSRAAYGFRVGAKKKGAFTVQWERCRVTSLRGISEPSEYEVRDGKLVSSKPKLSAAASDDSLYLTAVSGTSPFRDLYKSLTSMGFYNVNPDRIKDLQTPDTGDFLLRDGSNLASVLDRMNKGSLKRVTEYLEVIVPGVRGAEPKTLGHKVSFEVLQEVAGDKHPWRFPAVAVSDGTLRALAILVALHQRSAKAEVPMTLVGVEEPESALHPGAAEALSDALLEASRSVQVVATSHSPELLDNEDIPAEAILAVVADKGRTLI
ncbi:MAG: AAA family ATPase, partial [Methanobacteriota archaeon]